MAGFILILEDDPRRVERFLAAIKIIDNTINIRVWSNARIMIQEVDAYLPEARLISLDHDLIPTRDDIEDPGDGLDVA